MSDLRDLYQEVILDHGRRPRNRGAIPDTVHRAEGHNPLCGDRLTVYLELDGEKISRATFEGSGCAISMASASLMTEAVTNADLAQMERLFEDFRALVTGQLDPGEAAGRLGKLAVFAGVSDYPVRVKCATLAWHTLRSAAGEGQATVTTE